MKVLAFGDSFVKMFLHCEPEVKHWKFKGKSVKGLAKQEDVQRRKIEREIRKAPNGTKILLFFGQVDFNYVRYYKVIKGEPPITEQTFKKYVEWVASMNYRKNISIVSIFPSPIKRQYVVSSLVSKGSYLEQQQNIEIDQKILGQFDKSPQTWELWNSWISQHCIKNKVDNLKLFQKNQLQPQFYDISNLTIHLRYVPVLKLVQKFIKISIDISKAQEIQKQYQKQKTNRISNSSFKLPDNICQSVKLASEQNQEKITQQINQSQCKNQQIVITLKQKLTEISTTQTSCPPAQQNSQSFGLQQVQASKYSAQAKQTKSQRKGTADLDTDTNIQKDRSKQKQTTDNVRSTSNQHIQESKKPKKKKKNKATKTKKKYVCVDEKQQSDGDDEGQMFLQLSKLSNKVKKRNS